MVLRKLISANVDGHFEYFFQSAVLNHACCRISFRASAALRVASVSVWTGGFAPISKVGGCSLVNDKYFSSPRGGDALNWIHSVAILIVAAMTDSWCRTPLPLPACRHQCPGGLGSCAFRSLRTRWQLSSCLSWFGVRIGWFRDLLGFHSHYGPLARRPAFRAFYTKVLQALHCFRAGLGAYRLERKLPDGDLPHWSTAPFHGARGVEEWRGGG